MIFASSSDVMLSDAFRLAKPLRGCEIEMVASVDFEFPAEPAAVVTAAAAAASSGVYFLDFLKMLNQLNPDFSSFCCCYWAVVLGSVPVE